MTQPQTKFNHEQSNIGRKVHIEKVDLLNTLQQVVFSLDASGMWVYLNSSWTRLTDFSQKEAIGKHFLDFIHPKDQSITQEYIQALFRNNNISSDSVAVRFLNKNRQPRWLVVRANAVPFDNNGISTPHIVGTLTDVTEQTHMQEQLEARYRSLRNFVNGIPAVLYRYRNDQNRTMEFISSGCQELTGYDSEQFLENRSISYTDLIHQDDKNHIWETVRYMLQEKRKYEVVHRIVKADGDYQWVINRGKGNFTTGGELLAFEGVMLAFEKSTFEQEVLRNDIRAPQNSNLLNLTLFLDRLQHATQKAIARENYAFTLLLVNIDQYNEIQKNLGLQTANNVTKEISDRIDELISPSNSICQLQNNQLGILVESSGYNIKNVTSMTHKIQELVQAPVSVGDNEIFTTASIGIVFGDAEYKEISNVLADAQNAVNRARALGGARYEISDIIKHGKAALQSQTEADLERALDSNELLVHWQPIISLKENKLTGLEARLCWPHPRHGMLYAENFIPNAEDTQLITPLWEWMLNQASQQIKTWSEIKGIENDTLNIQISGATLLDADSILRLHDQLLSVKPASFSLVVGVSENVLNNTPRAVASMLKPIAKKNIQLLLDNFGVGRNSFSILRKTPVNILRLDQTLINDCVNDQGKFIRAITALAHNLGICVTAKGVNSKEQLSILNNTDIDYVQGDNVSKMIDEQECIDLLEKDKCA